MNDWKEVLRETKAKGNEIELKIGSIFKMPMNESHKITTKNGQKDRDKLFIVIGFTEDSNIVGIVIINSNINEHDFTPELYIGHYELRECHYKGILIKNSFACCNDIKELKKKEVIERALHQGCLIDEDCDLIISHLKESKIITPKIKKKYGLI